MMTGSLDLFDLLFHTGTNFLPYFSAAHLLHVESWGAWDPWSPCSVSCGEGVRERVRQCLSRLGVPGVRCPGLGMEQSPCSLEDCLG